MEKAVLTGEMFTQGDIAAAEGALAAGCRFFAGYPITPATEIAERMAYRLPRIGGRYIQMEDEIASCTAIVGASYSGVKSMTATSGPGVSLMNETIGLAVMTETPMVLVNVMRGGPSTGQPTEASQSDIMQSLFGEKTQMRGDQHIGKGEQPGQGIVAEDFAGEILIKILTLFFIDIQTGRAYLLFFQGIYQVMGIDELAPACIDNHNRGFHHSQALFINHVIGVSRQRTMQRNNV